MTSLSPWYLYGQVRLHARPWLGRVDSHQPPAISPEVCAPALPGSLSCWQEGPTEGLLWAGQTLLLAAAPSWQARLRQAGSLHHTMIASDQPLEAGTLACRHSALLPCRWRAGDMQPAVNDADYRARHPATLQESRPKLQCLCETRAAEQSRVSHNAQLRMVLTQGWILLHRRLYLGAACQSR